MKRTKIFMTLTALALTASLGFVSCANNDDGESTTDDRDTYDTDGSARALDDAAFNLLRSLCSIDDDEDGVENLGKGSGSKTFELDEGVVLPGAEEGVRSIACDSFDYALEYFSDLVGFPVSVDDLSADSYTWNEFKDKLGTLTFRKVTGEEDEAYAVIDVDVKVLNVKQLRFVPSETIASSGAENSYSGKPYYNAGDIIRRVKDSTYWMCVRPAGGNLRKDKSYWICLNPCKNSVEDATECIIDKTTETVTRASKKGKVKQQWIFAKNLMSLKTAKAAYHTLNALSNSDCFDIYGSKSVYDAIVEKGYDLRRLRDEPNEDADDGIVGNEISQRDEDYDETFINMYPLLNRYSSSEVTNIGRFTIAYGSVTKDKARITSGKNKNADTQYVQPVLIGNSGVSGNSVKEIISLTWQGAEGKKWLLSATDGYDVEHTIFWLTLDDANYKGELRYDDEYESVFTSISAGPLSACRTLADNEQDYDFLEFVHVVDDYGNLSFRNSELRLPQFAGKVKASVMDCNDPVIFSPELCIKDNKGKGDSRVRPVNNKDYEDILVTADNGGKIFDWWGSLKNTTREVDGKKVNWNSENN